jgi:peptidoglycan/xylan/chitin deacetylase (PgdA/CDA1 family)
MKALLLSLLLATSSFAGHDHNKQFADDNYDYIPGVDQGFDQYKAKSLYKTGKIVLTFDDGPHPVNTPRLLDILKKYNAKATFFILTRKVNEQTRPILERILKEGHILASHDHDHDNNNSEPMANYYEELKKSITLIKSIEKSAGVEQNGIYYRFPYGAYGRAANYHHFNVIKDLGQDLFGENCINFAFWDIDSADWGAVMTADKIAQNVIAYVKGGKAYKIKKTNGLLGLGRTRYKVKSFDMKWPYGGGVALLHDIHKRSIEATEIILKRAKKEGLEVVPLTEVQEYTFKNKSCYL